MTAQARQQTGLRATLLLAIVLACLLHLVNISAPTLLVCLALWAYQLLGFFRPLPSPGPRVLTVAGALCFVLIAATNEGLTVEFFVSLLVLMISLKLFEFRGCHDAMMTAILNYFVVASGMFFSDSLLVTCYIALCLVYNNAALVRASHPGLPLKRCLRWAGRLTLQALPFMVILFLVFPRFQGGLWGRPSLIQARSGVNDTLKLGGVAEVARNMDVAFRVHFDGPLPLETLYWRGLVLWHFDGETWTRGPGQRSLTPDRTQTAGMVRSYRVTLEPHEGRWLYTLDRPLTVQLLQPPRGLAISGAGVVEGARSVSGRVEYQATSDTAARMLWSEQNRMAKVWGRQLPESGNPRARALAALWQGRSPGDIVNSGLAFFGRGGFRYTLAPDEDLGADAIDAFLFERRAGFCEHFAASFAFLMRAAGLPTRLVVGYLGGTVNPYGGYLAVRHADAHVWCEVLLNGEWQRIDPTAVVAPGRLRTGSESRAPAPADLTLSGLFSVGNLPSWLQPLGNGWDYVNMRWNQLVMQYSAARQRQLFAWLGLDWGRQAARLGLLIAGIAVLGIGYFLVAVFMRRSPREEADAVAQAWRRFREKLEGAGVAGTARQGPVRLLAMLEAERPDLARTASAVVQLYIRLRYANTPEAARGEMERELVQAVRDFRAPRPGKQP